jgi:hypothetical protein
MRQGRPVSRAPLSVPIGGASPPAPDDPPVGAIVPPAPPEPAAAPVPGIPPAPAVPVVPRNGGSFDEQLAKTKNTAAHSQAMPKHCRHRFIMTRNLPLNGSCGGPGEACSIRALAAALLRLLWNLRLEHPAHGSAALTCLEIPSHGWVLMIHRGGCFDHDLLALLRDWQGIIDFGPGIDLAARISNRGAIRGDDCTICAPDRLKPANTSPDRRPRSCSREFGA